MNDRNFRVNGEEGCDREERGYKKRERDGRCEGGNGNGEEQRRTGRGMFKIDEREEWEKKTECLRKGEGETF